MYRTLTILAVGLVLLAGIGQSVSNKRASVAGKFALEIDGVATGYLSSTEGGGCSTDVIEELGRDGLVRKHIAGVKYEDITVTCGTGMSKALYDWIKASFDHKYSRKNGAIIAADFDYKERSRLEFKEALITEIGFPALDASRKDAAKMTLKLMPALTRAVPGTGTQLKPIDSKVQKKWLPANFRITIPGCEEACSRVNKIDAFTIKQKVAASPEGVSPIIQDVSDLVITFPESHSKELYDWHESFVIKGNTADERTGTLEYLAPDLKEVLFTLQFMNLGLFRLAPEKVQAGGEQIRRVKAEMYCEEMRLNYGAGAVAAP